MEGNNFLLHQSLRSIDRSCRFVLTDLLSPFAVTGSEPPLPFPMAVIQPHALTEAKPSATVAPGAAQHHSADAAMP